MFGYNRFLGDSYILELDKKRWTKVATSGVCPALAWHSATVIRHEIFVFGGMPASDCFNGDVYVLLLDAFIWRKLSLSLGTPPFFIRTGPEPRASHCTIAFGDCLLIFGGVGRKPKTKSVPKPPAVLDKDPTATKAKDSAQMPSTNEALFE